MYEQKKLIKLFRQIIKFGIVGVICFFIDYGLLIFLTKVFGVYYLVSAAISFTVSVIVNYKLSMKYVFRGKDDISRRTEFIIFVVLSVIGLGLNEIFMYLFTDGAGIKYYISKIGATVIVMIWNFVTRKIFLEQKDENTPKIRMILTPVHKKIIRGVLLAVFLSVIVEWAYRADVKSVFRDPVYYPTDQMTMENGSDDMWQDIAINEAGRGVLIATPNDYVASVTVHYSVPFSSDTSVKLYYTPEQGPSCLRSMTVKARAGTDSVTFNDIKDDIATVWVEASVENSSGPFVTTIGVNEFSLRYFLFPYNYNSVARIVVFSIIAAFIAMLYLFGLKKVLAYGYRYRFWIGFVIILLFTICGINGSSISYFSYFLPGYTKVQALGTARFIRSDEWSLFTPMMISQSNSGFHYFSELYRGGATDMAVVYGQPIMGFITLFRPFFLVILFAGEDAGVAFYWIARLIVLFLVTFETGMLITDKDKRLSLVLAIGIAGSPFVQWWFAVNGVAELFIFSQLALLLVDRYMKTDPAKRVRKLIYALLFAWCGGCFVVILYPAWQVPVAYIALTILIWIIVRNHRHFHFTRYDLLNIMAAVALLAVFGAYYYHMSGETIHLVMNTVYPGTRVGVGGDKKNVVRLFESWGNILLPYANDIGNVTERSRILDFFPLGILISVYAMIKRRKADLLSILFLILDAVFIAYMMVPWPERLAKVTLFSYTNAGRIIPIVGALNLFLFARALSQAREVIAGKLMSAIMVCCGLLMTCGVLIQYDSDLFGRDYLELVLILAVAITCVITRGVLANVRKHEGKLVILVLVLAIVSGFVVNPIQAGVSGLTNSSFMKEIESLNNEEPGLWVVADSFQTMNNVPTMVGAATLNSTSTYPNFAIWEILDPEGEYEDYYNRYLHVNITVSDAEEPTYALNAADSLELGLSLESLKKLNVHYIMSGANLKSVAGAENHLTMLYEDGGYYIYKLF